MGSLSFGFGTLGYEIDSGLLQLGRLSFHAKSN
jgi:hypothetical protein